MRREGVEGREGVGVVEGCGREGEGKGGKGEGELGEGVEEIRRATFRVGG